MAKSETQKGARSISPIKYDNWDGKSNKREIVSPFEGMHLEHFCHVTDDTNKVIFLLSTSDIGRAKQFIKMNNMRARKFQS